MKNQWDRPTSERTVDPKTLLRTPEDTLQERELRGENPFLIDFKNEAGEFVGIGLPHTLDLETIGSYKDIFTEKHPDVVLLEGSVVIVEGSPLPENLDSDEKPENVIAKFGEQGYFAWMAKKAGIPVEYWDLNFEDKIKIAIENHEVNAVLGFFMGSALKVLFENQVSSMEKANEAEKITDNEIEQLKRIFQKYITPELAQYVLEKKGLDITSVDFDGLAQTYCGKPLHEITFGDVASISDPYVAGPTNEVVRDLNKVRDEKAIEMIDRLKSQYKIILATGGLDHLVTWEPAIQEIYKQR